MPSLPIYTVDAFTKTAFGGNPAAICPLKEPIPEELYQKIAFELNLSETAFIAQVKDGGDFKTGNKFGLRWFTPAIEVPLCGHATLASAHVLFNEFKNSNTVITFETLSGELRCVNLGDGIIQLDFPTWKIRKLEGSDLNFYQPLVKECVGDLPVSALWYSYAEESKKLIIVLDEKVDRSIFESLKPNSDRLFQFDPAMAHVKGVAITMKGTTANGCVDAQGTPYHFVSRFFAPWFGVSEDPVCGSMHCALAPLWSAILGENKFYVRQCSPRGGELHVELKDDGRVYLRGTAVTLISGQIAV